MNQSGIWQSLAEMLLAVVVASSVMISFCGWGRWISQTLRWDTAWMVGLGTVGTLMLPISFFVGPRWGLLLLPIGWWRIWFDRWNWTEVRLPTWHISVVMILAIWMVWNASLPIVDTDALYYHHALPKHMWLWNELKGGELSPNGSRPLIWHLPLTLLYGLGGHQAVVLFASWTALGAWTSLVRYCEEQWAGGGWWVWAAVFGSYSLLEQSMVTANNMVVLWWVWLAWREQHRPWIWGALLGFAVAGKFTAVGVVALIGLTARRSWSEKFSEAFIAGMLVAVWLGRNWLDGVHPLFPYLGWEIPMPFVWVEKYGMGRNWSDIWVTPWNLLVHAKVGGFPFLGQVSPVFGLFGIVLLFGILVRKQFREGLVLLGAFVFWFVGPHWIRHLFPMIGVGLAIAIQQARYFPQSIRWSTHLLVMVLFGIGLQKNLAPWFEQQMKRSQGEQTVVGDHATQWLNRHADGTVALFCLWTGGLLDKPYVLSSVEDHTPVRHWSLRYGAQAIVNLKQQGVRYVAVGPHAFYQSGYPFLTETEIETDLRAPIAHLESQLWQHGRWITRLDGVDIYLLD